MSEMVDQVARALDPLAWSALGSVSDQLAFRRGRSREMAVAAITAMREPTEEMVQAGAMVIGGGPDHRPGRTEAVIEMHRDDALGCHSAMIDAALYDSCTGQEKA